MGMANVLNEEKKQQVLGTAGVVAAAYPATDQNPSRDRQRYLKAAGIAVRPPSGWGRCEPKPANESEVITGFGVGVEQLGTEKSQMRSIHQRLRAVPESHRVRAQPRPQCAGHLTGFSLCVRLRQQSEKVT